MGKKGGSAPAAPDPYETASAEAQFNRVDTYSPSGSGVRYGFTNSDGEFQQGTAPQGNQSAVKYLESPEETQIREMLEPASVALTDRVVQDNIYNMPDAARVQDRSDVAQDIFDRTFSLMAPGIDRANSRLLNNLQGRGIPIGSEAFNETYGNQMRETQDTIARLAMDANINAGNEQSRQFGLDQAERSGSISELVAAMGGGYNPPSSVPSGNAASVNYSGLVGEKYRADMAQYNQQQQQAMQTAGTVGTIGAALLKCTRQAKDLCGPANTDNAALIVSKLPLHAWTYKEGEAPIGDHGGMHVGPMAEDFQSLTGLGRSDRIDMVDYLGIMTGAMQNILQRTAMLERAVVAMSARLREAGIEPEEEVTHDNLKVH